MTLVEFCEQNDLDKSNVGNICKRLKICTTIEVERKPSKYRRAGAPAKIRILTDEECQLILDYIEEQKEAKKKKPKSIFGRHSYECNRCGCHVRIGTTHCVRCKNPLDWDLLAEYLPKKVTWTNELLNNATAGMRRKIG